MKIITDYPIAVDSPDHLIPGGTCVDNSRNYFFNRKLYQLFQKKPLFITDWGCSGGGFVKDCLDDGHIAVGLEGSDYSKSIKRAEWATIPNNLFTCDISKEFKIVDDDGQPILFDVITLWEVIEHIKEADLPQVFDNIYKHLSEDGLCIMSVATSNEPPHHQTIQERSWWMDFIKSRGFVHHQNVVEYFNNQFIRGPLQYAYSSFIVCLSKLK